VRSQARRALVDRTFQPAQPEIRTSDQGSHVIRPLLVVDWQHWQGRMSLEGKGRALANRFTERLWKTRKEENVSFPDSLSPREAPCGLAADLTCSRQQRPPHFAGVSPTGGTLLRFTVTGRFRAR
jgi:hypothetical protein